MSNIIDKIYNTYHLRSHYLKTKFIPINFAEELLQENQKELNDTLKEGFRVGHVHKRENGVVFELWKWEKKC